MNDIPESVIVDLIYLGHCSAKEDIAILIDRLAPFDEINRLYWKSWDAVSIGLDESSLAALAKGLVIMEESGYWPGGSVAGAIWVFRQYEKRFRDRSDALAEWILTHSNNDYVPFGFARNNLRSVEAVHAWKSAQRAKRQAKENAQEFDKNYRAAQKSMRTRMIKMQDHIKRATAEARRLLIEDLKAAPVHERLMHIALDTEHPLEFYPVELLNEHFDKLGGFETWALKNIIKRAEDCGRGPWRKWGKAQLNCNEDNQ